MVTKVCTECNFRFEPKSKSINKKCPYCGKQSLIEEKKAEELLEE